MRSEVVMVIKVLYVRRQVPALFHYAASTVFYSGDASSRFFRIGLDYLRDYTQCYPRRQLCNSGYSALLSGVDEGITEVTVGAMSLHRHETGSIECIGETCFKDLRFSQR
jgi:hypothetical protein